MAANNVRKRQQPKSTTVESDSDSSIEDIPRHPTFYEQIEAHHANVTTGPGINISKIKIPLARKLGENELIQDFTVEEYDIAGGSGLVNADGEAVIGDVGQAAFFTVPLIILLVGLDLIVHKQYRDEIIYGEIITRALKSIIPMWALVYATHPRSDWRIMQVAFFLAAVIAGCFMVHSVNVHGYYHVMQRAPPLGTIMIWSVIEMELVPALATCAAIGGYTWYKGFSIL